MVTDDRVGIIFPLDKRLSVLRQCNCSNSVRNFEFGAVVTALDMDRPFNREI